jgi:hypothetical protein
MAVILLGRYSVAKAQECQVKFFGTHSNGIVDSVDAR